MNRITPASASALAFSLLVQGCGSSPNFDIPSNEKGPTLSTISQRITCELVAMIKDHPDPADDYAHKAELLSLNYKMVAALSLDVTESGEVAPSFNYPATSQFGFNAGLKLSRARTQNFTENLSYSFNDLHTQWKENKHLADCPDLPRTNLAGDLALEKTVSLAFTASNRDVSLDQKTGEFGGSVNFVIVKNVNALGPTWKLTHFTGPGNFATFGRSNTDKLTFAFARAPKEPPTQVGPGDVANANGMLQQLLLGDVARSFAR